MSASHFVHIHGNPAAGERLIAAAQGALLVATRPGETTLLHTPINLPGDDPLPVDQDARLLLCQFEGADAAARAAMVDAAARGIAGVNGVTHQLMRRDTNVPGGPEDPLAPTEAVSWIVQYNGPAADPAAFHAYYLTHHVPIVLRMPCVRSLNCYFPAVCVATAGLQMVDHLQLIQALFDDLEGLLAMRRSAQRKEGLQDFKNYPAFEGPVTHQAMRSYRLGA